MSGPEDNPADDVQPTKEEWEAYEREQPPLADAQLAEWEREAKAALESPANTVTVIGSIPRAMAERDALLIAEVQRLRAKEGIDSAFGVFKGRISANEEIAALKVRLAAALEALRPFAELCEGRENLPDGTWFGLVLYVEDDQDRCDFTIDDCRKADAILKG